MKILCFWVLLLFPFLLFSQEKKNVEALFTEEQITIDGILDEPVWSQAQPAKDFIQLRPYNGRPAGQPSEVFFLYDQTSVYVGAMLYDSAPDSIHNFFSERDNIGMSDYFGVYFDPYNEGQLAYGFFITPAGVQTDIKAVTSEYDNEDGNWDAVWQSRTRVTDKGWIAEMRIPYSALRFNEKNEGNWGLNMFRNIRRYNSNTSWNFIDAEVTGFIHQEGQLTGIHDITPPVRLSFSPYAAAYAEFKEGSSSPDFLYKGGMDLKYGISESFTLDMMLIPDFGQIQSDDQQLNLTPYELYYSERRQFFTEGTELFNRAGIFYSRRIGARPKFSGIIRDTLKTNEVVDYSPSETQLINTTKISGRTQNGWGIGFLNAMSAPSNAILNDTVSGIDRKIKVQPFTNYNVSVIDKSLKNNSYFSLINTNILMADNPFRANVTGTDFQLRNKAKTYSVKGKGAVSIRSDGENETGFFSSLGFEKNSGKFQYGVSAKALSDKYNPNDLGYLRRNNEITAEIWTGYYIHEPFSVFRQMNSTIWWDHLRMYRNASFSANQVGLNWNAMFMNNYGLQFNVNFTGNKYDYYEARLEDRYYYEPQKLNFTIYGYTDNRKSIRLTGGFGGYRIPDLDQSSNWVDAYLRVRIGRKYIFEYDFYQEKENDDRGFVNMNSGSGVIYFARRDVKTIQNVIANSYALNNKAGLTFRLRHYWSGVMNHEYYQLQSDGSLISDPLYSADHNNNYNAFNIDLIFRWIFAPGSELTLAWKNSILTSSSLVTERYFDNLGDTWSSDQTNSISLKVLYYIDYNNLRRK